MCDAGIVGLIRTISNSRDSRECVSYYADKR